MRSIALTVSLLLAQSVAGVEPSGIVTEVHDGDTVTLVNLRHTYRIRLADIDAPELGQQRDKDARGDSFPFASLAVEPGALASLG